MLTRKRFWQHFEKFWQHFEKDGALFSAPNQKILLFLIFSFGFRSFLFQIEVSDFCRNSFCSLLDRVESSPPLSGSFLHVCSTSYRLPFMQSSTLSHIKTFDPKSSNSHFIQDSCPRSTSSVRVFPSASVNTSTDTSWEITDFTAVVVCRFAREKTKVLSLRFACSFFKYW